MSSHSRDAVVRTDDKFDRTAVPTSDSGAYDFAPTVLDEFNEQF